MRGTHGPLWRADARVATIEGERKLHLAAACMLVDQLDVGERTATNEPAVVVGGQRGELRDRCLDRLLDLFIGDRKDALHRSVGLLEGCAPSLGVLEPEALLT